MAKQIIKNWLVILAIAAILLAVLDFEYLKFKILGWLGENPDAKSISAPINLQPNQAVSSPSLGTTTVSSQQQPKTVLTKPARPPEVSAFTLEVESLDISAPIVYVFGTSEKEFQAGLIYGVVLYPGTALPGLPGNTYIFGHSSDYIWSQGNYKTIFANLPKIQIGAEIIISRNGGEKFSYKVFSSKKVGAKDISVLKQDYSKKILTLQTSYPVGTALARWVVVAELVK